MVFGCASFAAAEASRKKRWPKLAEALGVFWISRIFSATTRPSGRCSAL